MPRGRRFASSEVAFTAPLPLPADLSTRTSKEIVPETAAGLDHGLHTLDHSAVPDSSSDALAQELRRQWNFHHAAAAVERFGEALVRDVLAELKRRDLSHVDNLGAYVHAHLRQAAREAESRPTPNAHATPPVTERKTSVDRLEPYRALARRYGPRLREAQEDAS